MPEESFQDKTEKATPKRREEARKKGQSAKSKELSSIAVLSTGILYLFFAGKGLVVDLGQIMRQQFLGIPGFHSGDHVLVEALTKTLKTYFTMLIPMMLVLCVVALLVNLAQTGMVWSVEALAVQPSKIDPFKGLKRLFSKRSLAELAKSLLKLFIVGWAAYSTLKNAYRQLLPLIYQEKVQIISLLGQESFNLVVKCCCVIALLAILDYFYQKWEFEQKLKMTKQEVKDEFKQTEGDPMVKGRIRSIQREMARRRMMEEVPKADVVITNPARLAIALRYDPLAMVAPVVVAKGANHVAARIREIAMENRIPLIENKPLAQNLYKLELDEEIPPQFYQVVAEILAYVYGLKNKQAQQPKHP